MKLSVVILNWNGENFLNRFLPSVVKYSDIDDCEVVVADNGSDDQSLSLLENEFPTVKIIKFDKNYGFTGGYNKAINLINSKYILLLNSDVEVTENYLVPLLQTIQSDDNIAAVMPKIMSLGDQSKFEYAGAAGGRLDVLGMPYCDGRILSKTETDHGQYDTLREVFWASGAAMLIRKEIYTSIGGLDEDYFAHMEEIDFCWRAKNRGYKIFCNPASKVYHLGGGTLQNNSPVKLYLNFRNSLYTLYKNLPTATLFTTLFSRMCLDGAIAVAYLLTCRLSKFKAILKAHIDFYKNIKSLHQKRSTLKRTHRTKLRGLLPLLYVFKA
ncbi:MAG: glycosyltransferase family 2 protein [Rikenellaceae bacterium]